MINYSKKRGDAFFCIRSCPFSKPVIATNIVNKADPSDMDVIKFIQTYNNRKTKDNLKQNRQKYWNKMGSRNQEEK